MMLILLLSTTAAVSVSGGEVSSGDDALLVTDIGTATAEDSAFFVGELVEKRDQFEKHYRLEDGSYTAVIYDSPVHY